MNKAIKEFSHKVSSSHKKVGSAIALLDGSGENPLEIVKMSGLVALSITPQILASRIVGKDLNPKTVRKVLFENRETRKLRRDGTFLWTVYDSKANISYIGFGAIVPLAVAERYTKLCNLDGIGIFAGEPG